MTWTRGGPFKDNIRQLPDGRWEVRMTVQGKIKRKIKDTQREILAYKALLVQVRDTAALGLPAPADPSPRRLRLYTILDKYLEGLEAERKASHTLRTVRQCIGVLKRFFPPRTGVHELGEQTVRRYWQWRLQEPQSKRGTRGGGTIHELAYLRAALRRAGIKVELAIPRDLRRTVPKRQRSVPNPIEIRKFLEAMPPNSPERAFCEFLALTGCRPGEARALTWKDVDMGRAAVKLPRSKTASVQVVALSPHTYACIKRWKDSPERKEAPGGEVFTLEGRPLGFTSLRRRVRKAARAAGLEDFEIYTLRHAVAATLAGYGVPLHDLMRFLGHSSVTTTQIYLDHSRTGARIDLMDRAIFGPENVTWASPPNSEGNKVADFQQVKKRRSRS